MLKRLLIAMPKQKFSNVAEKPTFSLQSSLPRLPIPTLENTAARYLKSLSPIASKHEIENSARIVEDFKSGLGKRLQSRLIEYDKRQQYSWLEDIWLEKAYLSYRESLMLNVNWYMVFKTPENADKTLVATGLPYTVGQLRRAAILAKYACDYKKMLEEEKVLIDTSKSGPLCMHQTQRMFGVTRLPQMPSDRLQGEYPARGQTAMVMVDEQVFVINVLNESIQSIFDNLKQCILELQSLKRRSPPIGILTSEHRDIWADHYGKIRQLNQKHLEQIEQSLFAICLDSKSPSSKHQAAAIALHGTYGRNRWFDKCIEFFVCPNSIAGCNGEHSPCDAVIPNQMTTFVLKQYFH